MKRVVTTFDETSGERMIIIKNVATYIFNLKTTELTIIGTNAKHNVFLNKCKITYLVLGRIDFESPNYSIIFGTNKVYNFKMFEHQTYTNIPATTCIHLGAPKKTVDLIFNTLKDIKGFKRKFHKLESLEG